MQVWLQLGTAIPLVLSKFGNAPRGSVLFNQLQVEKLFVSTQCIEKMHLTSVICLPLITCDSCIAGTCCYVANEDEHNFFNGLNENGIT